MKWLSRFRPKGGGDNARAAPGPADPAHDLAELLPPEVAGYLRTAYVPTTVKGAIGSSSGFGGQPFLPDGTEHPICPQCDRPMSLLAQLAIDELPEEVRPAGTGLLQVFYSAHESDGQPCDDMLEGWAPFSEAHVLRLVPLDAGGRPSTSGEPFPPRRVVRWDPAWEVPGWEERGDLGVKLEDTIAEAIDAARIPLDGEKLGGWPAWIQGVEYPTCPVCGSSMRFVLQIDSEHNLPIMFGDVGTGHVTQCPNDPEILAFAWACS